MKLQEWLDGQESATIGIMGMKNCGKTYLGHTLHFREKIRTLYVDPVGGLRKHLPELDVLEMDKETTREDLIKFAKGMKAKAWILDISDTPRAHAREIMDWLWEYLKASGELWAVVLDEAPEIIPQSGPRSEGFLSCIRIGRNKGVLYMVLITQRPQDVAKEAWNLTDVMCIFRLRHKHELQNLKDETGMDEDLFEAICQRVKKLKKGQYILTDGTEIWEDRREEKAVVEPEKPPAEAKKEPKKRSRWTPELQKKVKQLKAKGKTNREIAAVLGVSVSSLKRHAKR